MPPDLSQSSPALRTPHVLPNTRPKERQYGTCLYRRGNLYYFRLIFPDDVKAQVGNSEIRLSLKTGYLWEAKRYAAVFRAKASTNLNELGFRVDVIETQLAHKEPDSVRLAYNRAQYMEERRKMMQAWADWLDATRAKA